VLFASFRVPNDPLRRAWAQFRAQVHRPPVLPQPPAEVQVGIWRLLASNNRELARSAAAYTTFAAARAHVLEIQFAAADLHPVIVTDPEHGYGWCVESGGVVVMTCARWQATAALASSAAKTAGLAIASADIAGLPLRMTPSGRRTRRALGAVEGSW
jgi:hypothetical protein